jgi:biofilm PGA synthesis N-glycosyltransferase PgaC
MPCSILEDPLTLPTYVVVTPARNEAELIEATIKSLAAQTVRPLKWIIVSDGSTDGTDEIVRQCAALHSWIELIRMPERRNRNFAGKVLAFNAGRARVQGIPYQVIVCLDADITFGPDYFSFLLSKLVGDARLGLVGTPYREETSEMYDYRFVSTGHVSGACQVFRRECFEDIGGYLPVKDGAIDTIAAITARMKGWKTRTFTERTSFHHRAIGTAQAGPIQARFNLGKRDFAIGNHPLWELFRVAYQMAKRPFILRGIALATGYVWASIRYRSRPVSRELIAFLRHEQMDRLRDCFVEKSRPGIDRRYRKQFVRKEQRAEVGS